MAYHRKIYLIDPKFQLKFSLLVCVILSLATLPYPLVIFDFMTHMIKSNPALATNLEEKKQTLFMFLALWQIGLTILVFVICIFFSHKIAGPMYKLRQFLGRIREGQPFTKLFFRGGDYFTEVADDLNETFEKISDDYKNDFVYLSEVNAYINNLSMVVPSDKKAVLTKITERLDEIQTRFK
jgi:ABC-type multidrug transport system fused ATPase/permease subunit